MGIKELMAQAGIKLPEGAGGAAGNFLWGFAFFIILSIVVIMIVLYIMNKKQYNRHIHMFEEIAGKAVPIGEDVAREIILPFTSIRAFLLKRRKVYLPRPSIQTGKGHYWYFIRKDGEWINVGMENLNKKMDELEIHYDHTDMRMANASLKKLVEKNYKKTNWIKEYAPYIAIGILVLLLGITAFLILNQADKVAGKFAGVAEQLVEVLKSLDSIKSSGSGIVSAG